jgi:hypothetical protein
VNQADTPDLKANRILQIVPGLPPDPNGIGDYAFTLATTLQERHSIDTEFLVTNSGIRHSTTEEAGGFLANRVPLKMISDTRRDGTDHRCVILHYVGYGFQKRGLPFELWKFIKRLKTQRPRPKIIVFFHELWASGPPWSSVFYLSWLQRWIDLEIAQAADVVMTSTSVMQDMLRAVLKEEVIRQPISGVFKDIAPVPSPKASRSLIIFGLEHTRTRSFDVHKDLIRDLWESGRVAKLVVAGIDAGTSDTERASFESASGGLPIQWLPSPSLNVLRASLAEASMLLSYYPADFLTKSASAMTAFSCGCPVVVAKRGASPPLREGVHYLAREQSEGSTGCFLRSNSDEFICDVGRRALEWYTQEADWPAASDTWFNAIATQ